MMASQAPFTNARALIFGGGRNIGRAVALEFARRGAAIAVADIDDVGAEEAAQLIIDAGGKAVAIRCDVTDDDSIQSAAAEAIDQLGEIDIVMNNAGLLHSGNPEDIPAT
jgi:NAD(P)-dependent dehydrogenase (short-subunit alcohol dehydrogenase family)